MSNSQISDAMSRPESGGECFLASHHTSRFGPSASEPRVVSIAPIARLSLA